jgi:TP901-1 family phage major tail protein
MAVQKGVDVVLKIGDGAGSEAFTTIGGARTVSMTINNSGVDATSASSTGQWREMIDAAGILSMDASFSGVFQDDSAFGSLDVDMRARTLRNFQIVYPDYGTYEGAFIITSLTMAGAHDGEATFEISLQSGGAITFTSA